MVFWQILFFSVFFKYCFLLPAPSVQAAGTSVTAHWRACPEFFRSYSSLAGSQPLSWTEGNSTKLLTAAHRFPYSLRPEVMGTHWNTGGTSSEHHEALVYCEDDRALAQDVQGGCVVSILGDTQNTSGHDPGQLALGSHAWAGELDQMTFRSPFQPQPVCDSVRALCRRHVMAIHSEGMRTC